MTNKSTSSVNKSLPWLNNDPKLDDAAYRLIRTLNVNYFSSKETRVSYKTERQLGTAFKNAEHGKSTAWKFMKAISDALGIESPEIRLVMASGKDWERAKQKIQNTSRTLHDLQRGRIYLSSVERYHALKKLLRSFEGKKIRSINIDNVEINSEDIDDYLAHPRKSGYAGALHMDLRIDLGKGRSADFELQFMPAAYEEVDRISHRLYDMIRILDEIPEAYKTREDVRIQDALIFANKMLYIEHGFRTGFIEVRKTKPPAITTQQISDAYDILDRLRTQIESLDGKDNGWRKETSNAITNVKTSLTNIQIAQENKRLSFPKITRD